MCVNVSLFSLYENGCFSLVRIKNELSIWMFVVVMKNVISVVDDALPYGCIMCKRNRNNYDF